jgi:hypothetical protein
VSGEARAGGTALVDHCHTLAAGRQPHSYGVGGQCLEPFGHGEAPLPFIGASGILIESYIERWALG